MFSSIIITEMGLRVIAKVSCVLLPLPGGCSSPGFMDEGVLQSADSVGVDD